MATERAVREAVEEFARTESSSLEIQDLFAAWVLFTQHQLNVLDALTQTGAAGGEDVEGAEDIRDGYAVFPGTAFRPAELLVVRGVLASDDASIARGLAELGTSLRLAGRLAYHGELPIGPEGPRLRRLRGALDAMSPAERGRVQIRGELVHLGADEDALQQKPWFRKAFNEFEVVLARANVIPAITIRSPETIRIPRGKSVVGPGAPREVGFDGTRWGAGTESVWIGRGRLADIVALYDHYREALFAKNVRTYLHHEARKPRSAARHIRQALETICAGAPDLYFTMAHNGITLTAPHVEEASHERVRIAPLSLGLFVLNGCQTVFTAWSFFQDKAAAEKKTGDTRWRTAWEGIWIPLRIVVTADEERVREVTVAANRQTEMRPSAFWAHDAAQIILDKRFGRRGIYYERQQGAWENLKASGSPRADEYPNGVINIEDLARVIAAASPEVSIDHAKGPAGIFDSEQVYRKVFTPEKTRSTALLTALYNVLQATRLALRDMVGVVKYLEGLPVMQFQYPVTRLFAAWCAENDPEWLLEQGEGVLRNAQLNALREEVRNRLAMKGTSIQAAIRDHWRAGEGWSDAYNAKLVKQAAKDLGLEKVSPFALEVAAEA
jgi:hypothetical protein